MPFTQELCRAGYEQLYMAGMVGRIKCPARCRGSTNETVASTKTNWKIDPSFLNFSIPSSFQQEPHPTKQSTPEQSGSLRLRPSPSHPSGITETTILLQGNTHTSPGGLIYVVAIPVSLRSLLPLLAQPCLDPGANQSPAAHTLAWFRVIPRTRAQSSQRWDFLLLSNFELIFSSVYIELAPGSSYLLILEVILARSLSIAKQQKGSWNQFSKERIHCFLCLG